MPRTTLRSPWPAEAEKALSELRVCGILHGGGVVAVGILSIVAALSMPSELMAIPCIMTFLYFTAGSAIIICGAQAKNRMKGCALATLIIASFVTLMLMLFAGYLFYIVSKSLQDVPWQIWLALAVMVYAALTGLWAIASAATALSKWPANPLHSPEAQALHAAAAAPIDTSEVALDALLARKAQTPEPGEHGQEEQ